MWSAGISLWGDDIRPNFHLNVTDGAVENAVVNVTVGSDPAVCYPVSELAKTRDGYYVLSAALAAAQMANDIKLEIVADGELFATKHYSVAQYAHTVLGNQSLSQYQEYSGIRCQR